MYQVRYKRNKIERITRFPSKEQAELWIKMVSRFNYIKIIGVPKKSSCKESHMKKNKVVPYCGTGKNSYDRKIGGRSRLRCGNYRKSRVLGWRFIKSGLKNWGWMQ